MSVPHSVIRGDFIRQYAERKQQYNNTSSKFAKERNQLHLELNRKFGYTEFDGSFGIGCKSHVDREYKRQYDSIEARFRAPYDDQLPALYRWCLENGMTIFECLLIDDIRDEVLEALATRANEVEDWRLRPINEKARPHVVLLKKDHTVGAMRRRLDLENSHQAYAAARCRRMFRVRPWDFSRQNAILDYGRKWKRVLNQAFGRLSAV